MGRLLTGLTGLAALALGCGTGGATPPEPASEQDVRLLADPIGSSIPITTPSLSVGPGQTVYWTIGPTASNSFASAD